MIMIINNNPDVELNVYNMYMYRTLCKDTYL